MKTWILLPTVVLAFALDRRHQRRRAHHKHMKMDMGRYGGPVYSGAPALERHSPH